MRAALLALTLVTTGARAGEGDYVVWFEQAGKVIAAGEHVVLARAPFSVVFKGPADNTYGVAGSVERDELPSSGNLDAAFRFGNGLLVDVPNSKISISDKGVVAKRWGSWNMWAYHGADETGFVSGFQMRTVNADGSVTFARNVDRLCVDDGSTDRCQPVASPVFAKIYLLATTIPPLRPGEKITDTRWLGPVLIGVEFK